MLLNLNILVDPDVSQSLIMELDHHLLDVFPINNIDLLESVELPSSCWDKSRHQFNANCLLAFAMSYKRSRIVVLIISKDAYVSGLNFVFGVASRGLGAVVSIYRLENDPDFIKKEIIHELGHVFGLKHCALPCVMTFSNSVWEARLKSSAFCEKCWKQLKQEF
ncbi:MAG: pentalenene synthase [Candidatus Heimdallarchaeota archaeon]|nr:MAG: pentalenene synthase [Candidatus Heimdallarchaeota archaeon]